MKSAVHITRILCLSSQRSVSRRLALMATRDRGVGSTRTWLASGAAGQAGSSGIIGHRRLRRSSERLDRPGSARRPGEQVEGRAPAWLALRRDSGRGARESGVTYQRSAQSRTIAVRQLAQPPVLPGSSAVSLCRSCPHVQLIAECSFSSACSPSTREGSGIRGSVDSLAPRCGLGRWNQRLRASVRHRCAQGGTSMLRSIRPTRATERENTAARPSTGELRKTAGRSRPARLYSDSDQPQAIVSGFPRHDRPWRPRCGNPRANRVA